MIIFSLWGFIGFLAAMLLVVFVVAKYCQHSYRTIETVQLYDDEESKRATGFYLIQHCNKCGKVKSNKVVW